MRTMMTSIRNMMGRLRRDERGLTAVEYAVLGAIVVAAIGVATSSFEENLEGAFTKMFAPADEEE
ncbi:Flp family type IVb pilin [Novosphingobium soli]|uniref:Flp family type IVb pilin n=1 Tax=Novosphingobium soli TaxID=574956 RepID=A0ABV6CVA2_9SPHN